MAGISAFDDLGEVITDGRVAASHWIESARILVGSNVGTAAADQAAFWPVISALLSADRAADYSSAHKSRSGVKLSAIHGRGETQQPEHFALKLGQSRLEELDQLASTGERVPFGEAEQSEGLLSRWP